MFGKWGCCDEDERSEDYKDDVCYCVGFCNFLDFFNSDYCCDLCYFW